MTRRSRRASPRRLRFAALALFGVLTGCGPAIDRVPTEFGGLPAGSPQRPQQRPPYPAVHDVPQERADPALTDQQQLKLEKELSAVRARQGTLQDPGAAGRNQEATAASTAAMEKAKAAAANTAKKKPNEQTPR